MTSRPPDRMHFHDFAKVARLSGFDRTKTVAAQSIRVDFEPLNQVDRSVQPYQKRASYHIIIKMSSISSTRSVIGQIASRSRAGARLAPACARCNSTSSKPNPYTPLQSNQPPTTGGAPTEGPTTHFGFKTIPQSLKESLVGNVFTSVSPKYDVMNDSMSLGIHRLWKESFVNAMVPRLSPSVHINQNGWENWTPTLKCLDVAGGTGDIALKILDKAREKYGNRDVEVEIVDLNEGMLFEGQKRVAKTVYYNSKPASWSRLSRRMTRLTPSILLQPPKSPSRTETPKNCRPTSRTTRSTYTPLPLESEIAPHWKRC